MSIQKKNKFIKNLDKDIKPVIKQNLSEKNWTRN